MLLAAMAAVGVLGACSDDDGAGPEQPAPLTSQEELVLDEAIQDAYRTYYTYTAVIEDLGAAQPFTAYATAELASIDALVELYESRGATPPASVWNSGNVPRYANLQEACMAAEEGEVATSLMFERMLRLSLRSEIRGAFEGQRMMARNTHRLAFRNCAGGTVASLGDAVEAAVAEAIQDEYRAFYTYSRVLEDLGDVLPFLRIRDAEWQHVGALANVYEKRDLAVPASNWTLANVPAYGTLAEACAAGVDGEIANVEMYDRLLLLDLPVDVERVFGNLRLASLEQHLPAFEACAN